MYRALHFWELYYVCVLALPTIFTCHDLPRRCLAGGFSCECPTRKSGRHLELERDTEHFMASGTGSSWSLEFINQVQETEESN